MPDASATVRALLRSPGYTLVVVLTLALTIGANSAIYSAVRAVLLRHHSTPARQTIWSCAGAAITARDIPGVGLDDRKHQQGLDSPECPLWTLDGRPAGG